MDRRLAERVLAWAKVHGRGFHDPIFSGPAFDHALVFYRFKEVCRRLVEKGHPDFSKFSPYSLRHTFAVTMVQGDPENGNPGVDLVTLARLMGHGDNIRMTMRRHLVVGTRALNRSGTVSTRPGQSDGCPEPEARNWQARVP